MNFIGAIPKKTLILVVFLALLFLFLLYLQFASKNVDKSVRRNSPAPTESIPGQNTQQQNVPVFKSATSPSNNYSIVFDLPDGLTFPPTIESITVARGIDESFISHLKNRLDFQGTPKTIGKSLFWQNEDTTKTLMIDISSGYVQYSDTKPTEKSLLDQNLPSTSREEATKTVEDFIKMLNVVNIQPHTENVTAYTQNANELTPAKNERETYFYEISYRQSYRGIPIYYHYSTPATITALIDIHGKVRSFKFFNIQPTRTTTSTLLGLEQMKKKATSGDYTIVRTSNPSAKTPTPRTITITTATLSYFDDKQSPSLFPIMLFEGVLLPENSKVSLYVSVLSR